MPSDHMTRYWDHSHASVADGLAFGPSILKRGLQKGYHVAIQLAEPSLRPPSSIPLGALACSAVEGTGILPDSVDSC